MITIVGGIKGGSGKTTIATNLTVLKASEGKKVLLVDADQQYSATDWTNQRIGLCIDTPWTTIQLNGDLIHSQIIKMAKDYDEVIIDVGGRDTDSQRSALVIANLFIIPFRPRFFDMSVLGKLKKMINETNIINPNLKSLTIINQADSRGTDNEEAFEMLSDFKEFSCFEKFIGNRKAFGNAAALGLGVTELKSPDPKANQEIIDLHNHIKNI